MANLAEALMRNIKAVGRKEKAYEESFFAGL